MAGIHHVYHGEREWVDVDRMLDLVGKLIHHIEFCGSDLREIDTVARELAECALVPKAVEVVREQCACADCKPIDDDEGDASGA